MQYNKESKEYKGDVYDCAHHLASMFSDGEELHAVYNFGSENQHITKENVLSVLANPDKYLFTPYIQIIYK